MSTVTGEIRETRSKDGFIEIDIKTKGIRETAARRRAAALARFKGFSNPETVAINRLESESNGLRNTYIVTLSVPR